MIAEYRSAFLAILVAAGFGCHNDVDALYRAERVGAPHDAGKDAGKDAAGSNAPQRDPFEAALHIYGDDEACVTCIARECESEARACAQDEACTEDARCRADCSGDPFCELWSCTNRYPLDDRPTGPLEEGCIQTKCLEPCRVGHDFDCVGKYTSAPPETDRPVALSMQLIIAAAAGATPFPEAGIRARVCAWSDIDCADPAGSEARSDASGMVSIAFPAARRVSFQLQSFAGYVELTDPDNDPPRTRPVLYVPWLVSGVPEAPPRSNTDAWTVAAFPESSLSLGEAVFGFDQIPGRGVITATVWDCRFSQSWRASGVTLEIEQADEETRYTYGMGPSITEADRQGYGLAWNVPPGIVTLKAFYAGMEVARGDVPVRADALTFVYLPPIAAR